MTHRDSDDLFEAAAEFPCRLPRVLPPTVIHEDEELLIINKPSGMWLDGPSESEPGIVEFFPEAAGFSADPEPSAAYPLDPELSGAVVLPRTNRAADHLRQLFSLDAISVVCLAIVRGVVLREEGAIELLIGHRRGDGEPFADPVNGAPTTTAWRARDRFIGFALLDCRPRPAVPHDVRMHLQSVDLPLAVDPRYGGADRLMLSSFKAGYRRSRRHPERPLIARVSMHVESVSLTHPASGEAITMTAPLPKDMRATIHQLERFGRMPP